LCGAVRSAFANGMSSKETLAIITDALAGTPEWVRTDLASRDQTIRNRAEETLAAIIGAALEKARD
jgi:hypothetical protein